MKRRSEDISFRGFDELFSTEESREDDRRERVVDIPIHELKPFFDHPFKVVDNEEMNELVESIVEHGVLSPGIVRPHPDGGYEILSGHRRCRALELAGIETMPVIVRDLDDDAASILLVDANMKREKILPSEKAYAYRLKMEAIERVKGRPKKEGQVVPHYFGKRTSEIVAEGAGESYKQVQRYIRLTELVDELLQMVDEGQLAFNTAVDLSFLTSKEQVSLFRTIDYTQSIPSLSQAQQFKQLSQAGLLTEDMMRQVLSEEKKTPTKKLTLNKKILSDYFPESYTPKQMEDVIVQLLEQWKGRQRSRGPER